MSPTEIIAIGDAVGVTMRPQVHTTSDQSQPVFDESQHTGDRGNRIRENPLPPVSREGRRATSELFEMNGLIQHTRRVY